MVSTGYDIRRTCYPIWSEATVEKFPYEIVKEVSIKNRKLDSVTIQLLVDILNKEISVKANVEPRLGFKKSCFRKIPLRGNYDQIQ